MVATVVGHPLTEAWDTALYVGSVRATLTSIERAGCDAWDGCVSSSGCNPCDDCDACDPSRTECRESATFVIPETTPGPASVILFNRHGESNALPFTVDGPPADTAPRDTADSTAR